MIELYPADGERSTRDSMTFEEMQEYVGGLVELVHIRENGKTVQVICNEDGLRLGLAPNVFIIPRIAGKVNYLPGPVGNWIILSDEHMLRD